MAHPGDRLRYCVPVFAVNTELVGTRAESRAMSPRHSSCMTARPSHARCMGRWMRTGAQHGARSHALHVSGIALRTVLVPTRGVTWESWCVPGRGQHATSARRLSFGSSTMGAEDPWRVVGMTCRGHVGQGRLKPSRGGRSLPGGEAGARPFLQGLHLAPLSHPSPLRLRAPHRRCYFSAMSAHIPTRSSRRA